MTSGRDRRRRVQRVIRLVLLARGWMSPILGFTPGSLGDIIAKEGLIAKVVKALYDNRHMSQECEELALKLEA